MAGEVVQREKGSRHRSRRPKRRVSIRLDMTPMVDIAFLLLIFYMVSTVFQMPQAMEINLPPSNSDSVLIHDSDLLYLWIDAGGSCWYSIGAASPNKQAERLVPDATDDWTDSLRALLMDRNRANPHLNTVVKINPEADYIYLVDVLDEIDIIERQWNFWLAGRLGKSVGELTKEDGRFSYRYALDEWQDKDSKIVRDAAASSERGRE